MPNGRVVGDDVMERAHARLVLCRDLTDEAQADCQVISDLLSALAEARKDTERLEWLDDARHWCLIRPGRNRIGVSVGGWLWTRGRIGVGREELVLDIREAIDAASEDPVHA